MNQKECLLHQRKLVNTIVSLTLPLSDGLRRVKLDILKLAEVSSGIGLTHLQPQWTTQLKTLLQLVELLLFTQECPQENRKMTLIDKFNISLRNIPTPKSFLNPALASARVLISTEKGCNPFLKKSLWEQYPLLLFLIKTACLGLDLTFPSGGFNVSPMIQNSLFSMTKTSPSKVPETSLLKTYLQSLTVSLPNCTLTESTQAEKEAPKEVYKSKKTKIVFSHQNKTLKLQEYLKDMSELYNESWNKAVRLFEALSVKYKKPKKKTIVKKKPPLKIKKTNCMSKKERQRISREIQQSKKRIMYPKNFKFNTFVPTQELVQLRKEIRNKEYRTQKQVLLCNKLKYNDRTVDSAFTRLQSIIKAQKSKQKYFFNLKFRSRKDNRIVTFNERDYNGLKRTFGCINGLEDIKGEFKFLYNKQCKEWYLITQEKFQPPPNTTLGGRVCSLDPGVREFQKIFSLNEGCVYTAGSRRDILKICKLKKEMEKAQSKLKTCSDRRKRQKLRRLRDLKATKVTNKRKDAHWKLALFMTDNFDTIILPDFKTKSMVRKKGSSLHKSTRKEMRDWGHYMFQEKLKWMCTKKGKTLIQGKEWYTSKTCCCCLTITNAVGSSKDFNCPNCPNNIDRDINGAINNLLIMLKQE